MNSRNTLLVLFTLMSVVLNVVLIVKVATTGAINPRTGKDCSVEMRSILDGSWEPVILVHGYSDNLAVAQYLVDLTENDENARGGRPKGSFRVKQL